YVVDDDTGEATATAPLVVDNVAPLVEALTFAGGAVNEGGTATLTGKIYDSGTHDTETITIDWGDGTTTTLTTSIASDGYASFSADHIYVDDDPSGTASDSMSVSVEAKDDDTGVGNGTTNITVNNVTPVV